MLRRIARFTAAVGLLALLLGAAGCGGKCRLACNRYNDMACGATCDCSVCDDIPSSCDEYLDCVLAQSSCAGIALNCRAPGECGLFVALSCR